MNQYAFINKEDIKNSHEKGHHADVSFTLTLHSTSLKKLVEKYELDNYIIKRL